MNKTLLSLAIALFVSVTIHATNIDRQQASQLARDFMSKNFRMSRTRQAQTVPLDTVETGQSLVYAFNVEGGGFVVVAGDDCAPAILGYSESSEIDPSDMPEAMKELFDDQRRCASCLYPQSRLKDLSLDGMQVGTGRTL